MLDPSAKARASIDDVLSHPWMNPLPRKSSLQLPPSMIKSRRQGIAHSASSSLQIRAKLIQVFNERRVDCNCHDKVVADLQSHCSNCQPIISTSRGTQTGNSTLSVSSSGYSSMECLAFVKNINLAGIPNDLDDLLLTQQSLS